VSDETPQGEEAEGSADLDTERGRVTPLELFFDLVFVFAITEVSSFLSHDPTWSGLLRGLLILAMLWWAWSAYAWLTNTLDPEEGMVRMAMFAAIAAMLVASLAVPGAFEADGITFAVAYLIVRLLHLALYAIAGRGDRDLSRAVLRIVPSAIIGPALLLVAGITHGTVRVWLWIAAALIDYLGPVVGHMRGWRVSTEHFVERFGLIIIIALGESIVAIGLGAAGIPLDKEVITAALLGVTVAACLWWSYFDWVIYVGQARLVEATGVARAALARDVFSYLHLPMVAGIVLFAFGLKTTLPHASDPLPTIPALGLFGGVGLYFLAHVLVRLRIGGGLGHGRPVATVVLFGLIPLGVVLPALGSLALVAAVCVGLIAYEALRYRESRAWIRNRRGAFTMEEARSVAPVPHRRWSESESGDPGSEHARPGDPPSTAPDDRVDAPGVGDPA
jgi:low temperature requirement protein LtrA